MEKTIAQEAYDLLKDIPEENWIIGKYTDGKGACCLLGHYNRKKSVNLDDYGYVNCMDHESPFARKVYDFLKDIHGLINSAPDVNDFDNINGYTQSTPKQRSMALLEDMIKHGY